METTTLKHKVAKFTCFVEKDADISPEGLKKQTPHVYRGVKFEEENREAIQRLFGSAIIPETLPEGCWIFEASIKNEYDFTIMGNSVVNKYYKKFDASGILGCGSGSERFKTN